MAARRGRGGRGRNNPRMENLGDERDAEIQALRRQVEELTLRLERQEARSGQGSSHGYSSDDSELTNPFAERQYHNFGRRATHPVETLKVDLPEFQGRLQPEEFLDWLSAVEKFFEYKEIPEIQKVKLVATRLRGYASSWWDKVQEMRLRKGKPKIASWEKMKARLRENFLPLNYAQGIFMQFNTLQQGNKSVVDYTEDFYKLMARCDNQESEDQLIARYINGLKPPIRDEVELQQVWKLNDAYQLALKVEAKISRRGARKFADVQSFYPSKVESSNRNASKGGKGENNPSASKTKPPNCFKCGQPGHYMNECPKRRSDARMGLVNEEGNGKQTEDSEPKYDDDDTFEREEIEPEEGECLVIQKVLATPRQDNKGDWLRHNIFRTRCKSHGRVCSLVIDGGSFENFVSEEMVDKLKLKVVPHPHPYAVSWIKKDNEVKIDKKCLVSFSMGKNYFDEVWCDVTPMDVGHILLGRPWQYDRGVIHDGRRNTYKFVMGKTEILLLPCKEEFNSKDAKTEEERTLLTLSQLEKEVKNDGIIYLLIVDEDVRPTEISPDVKVLLEEFSDVVPRELPAELPPLREIQHQIDLIPGAALPNKAHYRMSPQEHDELHQQVLELLSKGYIRESLSLCAVPALLTPKKDGSWRICIESRALNRITVRYRFPIPRIDDMFDMLAGAQIFSKIDLRSGYHQIRIKPGDEWKTAFKTREGLYEWLVMPFGLSNAPSTFMRVMNRALHSFIGKFVVVYFDDILVYSRNSSDHIEHLRMVLITLRKEKLYVNLGKCSFMTTHLVFLGFILTPACLMVDGEKIKVVQEWPIPKNYMKLGVSMDWLHFIGDLFGISVPLQRH